ncbi:Cthe_2314 family HEPN domain-containing protein [Paenibacillus sp. 481]|uniref:Cthe_2314 family HEPN domain-containing protein n=1 Tax=Paenibacillus sp. 481 TaxID=2835869 RepID=UPI001E3294AA|nr:Cthe_2314 family HEPN domain-containing protein [Paenibacillus sp. 481]UHA74612.1 hypothetical protein KIK04_05855 [Paenibacillus sp. 481]
MLRVLFGEIPRQDEGELKQAMSAMNGYLDELRSRIAQDGDPKHIRRKAEIMTVGLKTSLDELEQSVYASGKYADGVHKQYEVEMNEAESDDYYRHVYYYKNGFIRVFAVLDKLGTLLNDILMLETEKVKHHFSYFTVLRQMRTLGQQEALYQQLSVLKEQYSTQLQHLRKRRNTEVHHLNAEMQDDLWQRHRSLTDKIKLEDIRANVQDLRDALTMVCASIVLVFEHLLHVSRPFHK